MSRVLICGGTEVLRASAVLRDALSNGAQIVFVDEADLQVRNAELRSLPEPAPMPKPIAKVPDTAGMKPWDLARRAAYERADAERAAIAAATGEA